MINGDVPNWLMWAREIQSLAQTDLHYAENEFARERSQRLIEIAAEIIAEYTSVPLSDTIQIFNHQIGYATPKVDVRGAVFDNDKLLLVREIFDNSWTMPGGWADVGDTPAGAVLREVYEEAGFVVKAEKVIGVYDANRTGPLEIFHAFKLVFLCSIQGGSAASSTETSEAAFFGYDEIPSPLSPARTPSRIIKDAFEARVNPDWQTVFD